jgi:hypothetical protein
MASGTFDGYNVIPLRNFLKAAGYAGFHDINKHFLQIACDVWEVDFAPLKLHHLP